MSAIMIGLEEVRHAYLAFLPSINKCIKRTKENKVKNSHQYLPSTNMHMHAHFWLPIKATDPPTHQNRKPQKQQHISTFKYCVRTRTKNQERL